MKLIILGIRGIPAAHGGFETFAEQLALHLTAAGWEVTVYCQDDGTHGSAMVEDTWRGIQRIHVPSHSTGSAASVLFDIRSTLDSLRREGVVLILGYNTGFLSFIPRFARRDVVINMDGIEWKRSKWSRPIRAWFWMNERAAALAGRTLIADHPEIAKHLATRADPAKIVTIPYGSPPIEGTPVEPLAACGVQPGRYWISVCRIEPENSVLEIVQAFSAAPRTNRLLVLGNLAEGNAYHRAVRDAAGPQVIFPGPIYDKPTLAALRYHARGYCHGHTVGGTNPSLVEALAAGSAVIAHDNAFNRWTAGPGQFFFTGEADCEALFTTLDTDDTAIERAGAAARIRFDKDFTLDAIMGSYQRLLTRVGTKSQERQAPVTIEGRG